MTNKTGLVALGVLAVSALLMVFFVLPNTSRQTPAETPAVDAAAEAGGETKTADGKQARTPAEDETAAEPAAEEAADAAQEGASAEAAAEPAAEEQAAAAQTASQDEAAAETAGAAPADPAADWVVPAFDLLRVEPDGSTVIAGRAEPNTKVEIRAGETVIATADVGPSGDFAAVFDEPLKAGDYQLTLNASDGKGTSRTSEEVATVSVPTDSDGEVLAMVSEPGAASRLITVPEEAGAAAAADEKPAVETASASPENDGAAAVDDAAPAAAEEDVAPAEEDGTAAAAASASSETAARAQVRVAAVELEGERMFVAGNTRPDALVRIYAGDRFVGEAKADAEGRFVVDGRIDLAVGRHMIRADVMSADGSRVELRASVPFDRPEGEQVAVVAQQDGAASAETTPALGLLGGGTFDKLRNEAARALSLLKGLFADGRVPGVEELAAARSATEIALKSLAEFKPGAEEGAAARDMAAKASAAAADALARLRALPSDAAGVGAALGDIEAAVAAALAPAIGTPDEAAPATEDAVAAASSQADQGATSEGATADAGTPATAAEGAATEGVQTAAGEPETVEQAPLQQSKTSVIIRRGDTLWQISRRIYGKGVRYTTIYLANQEQIADPDRIVPGQVFGVPDEATESDVDAEAQHRRRLRGE